jgi:spore germination protein YaaH
MKIRLIIILLIAISFRGMFCFASDYPLHGSTHLEHSVIFGDSLFQNEPLFSLDKSSLSTELTHQTYGFVPYWQRTYNCPRWDLVSRIAYFSLEIGSDGSISATNYWSSASVVGYAQAAGVPVDLCITCFSSSSIANILTNATARGNSIHNSINQMLLRGANGINIDFETPPSGYGDALVTYCRIFRDSLDARAPGSWLSVCMGAVDWGGVFNASQLKNYCDALFIMGYDYYWGGSSYTGPVDPLDDPTETYDIARSISDYATDGATRAKLVLGLPLYGRDWPCSGNTRRSATTGTATAVLYSTAIVNAVTYGRLWDTNAKSPWYCYGSYRQCWYSDSGSLDQRYAYAISEGLMGGGWWALGYDAGDLAFWNGVEYRFASGSIPDADTLLLDDGNAGYTSTGSWTEGSYDTLSAWWRDYKFANAGGATETATWTPNFPSAAQYDVYLWWLAGSNRCNNVPVTVSGTSTTTVYVSQQGSGAMWHYIGRFNFNSGSSGYVRISDSGATGGSVVIADGCRFVRIASLLVEEENESIPTSIGVAARRILLTVTAK